MSCFIMQTEEPMQKEKTLTQCDALLRLVGREKE